MRESLRRTTVALAGLALLGSAGAANADLILFDPTQNGSNVNISSTLDLCIGCNVSTSLSSTLDSDEQWLGVGESWTFDFFDIFVGNGLGGETVDISATLAFVSPDASATLGGFGGYGTIVGVLSGGFLTWNGPTTVDVGGTRFDVNFSNLLALGLGNSATVTATVTLQQVASVPEPATLTLLGLGLLGLGFARTKPKRVT